MRTTLHTNQWTKVKWVLLLRCLHRLFQEAIKTNGTRVLIQSTRLAQDNTFWTCPFWLMSSWLSRQSHPEIFPPLRKEHKKEHQYGLHPVKTVGDTFVCVRVHSHPSAAWTPGQNHDYQLHSSPSPIMGNREKTTSLTNPKMSIIIYKFTHQVVDPCQFMFDI